VLSKSQLLVKDNRASGANRRFEFQKRCQLFIRPHNEAAFDSCQLAVLSGKLPSMEAD
jgi:hypothetical protein